MSASSERNVLANYGSSTAASKLFPRFAASRWLSATLDDARRACGAFEWVTLGYLSWVKVLIAVGYKNVTHPVAFVVAHAMIAVAIVALAIAALRHPQSKFLRFARHGYPLPLYIGLFEELNYLVHAIFPGWLDPWFIAFDHALTGVHPSVWLSQFANPALNDFMQFAYMTYFLYLVILPAMLFVQKEHRAFWAVMVSTAIAHYTVYFIAVVLPVESPYYSLAALQHVPLTGGFSTHLIGLVERFGRVRGAAFPSAHVAGSLVAILASWRYRRWLFWICLPLFLCMCVATVYGRYHYVADVLGGLLTGAWGFYAGQWLIARRGALPEQWPSEAPAILGQ
jgi:membrane-associated phospholipid phosphatase